MYFVYNIKLIKQGTLEAGDFYTNIQCFKLYV